MRRWSVIFFGLIFFVSVLLFFGTGFNYYLSAKWQLNRLPADRKVEANDEFFTLGEPNLYGGVYAGLFGGKIWIWGRDGLRGFGIDDSVTYSFATRCKSDNVSAASRGQNSQIYRQLFDQTDDWELLMKRGYYITVALYKVNGIVEPNVREVYGYDWWVYIPSEINKQCEK